MAFETEKQPKLVLLSQSNALKWAATEKQVKLDAYLKGEETYWKKKTVMIHLQFLFNSFELIFLEVHIYYHITIF